MADLPGPRRGLRDSTGDTAMLGAVRIERLGDLRAAGFGALQDECEQAGLRFLRRLADEWASGVNRFDRPGEVLFGARIRGELVAVGGLNVDPYATATRVGRVRHVYVLSAYRRLGVGRQLVAEIVAEARGRFDSLRLSTANPAAARLYQGLGFARCADVAHCSHVLDLVHEEGAMLKLDHLRLPVTDLPRSCAWYTDTLGLTVELEVPDRQTVALQDGAEFTLFLQQGTAEVQPGGCALWFQVDDVDATHAAWATRGVQFAHAPRKTYWGYGAELQDPDGYLVRLWDPRSMRER